MVHLYKLMHTSARFSFLPLLFISLLGWYAPATAQTSQEPKEDIYGLRGMPSCPLPRTFEQPDGSSFQGRVVGSMRLFYVETLDGYTVLKDESDGFLKYAVSGTGGDLFLTNARVSEIEKRTPQEKQFLNHIAAHARYEGQALTQKKLKATGGNGPQYVFPSTGIRKALMILIDFPNQTATYTAANVDSLLNAPGYNYNGQSGSFKDYYSAISYGMLTISSDVMGWYTAPFNKAAYGYSNGFGVAVSLVRAAVDSAEAHGANFAQYDGDNDGQVDVVMVLHSGRGTEESGNTSDIWSHRWVLSSQNLDVIYDGKLINDYIIQPEKYGTTSITNIGVICHEFGHALGLPDLYDTDNSSEGLGNWCLMAGGSWNNSGKTPAQMSAWCKKTLGWATPVVLTGSGNITGMKNLNDTPQIYRMNTPDPQQYFLIENRQNIGWDASLPGSGVCIYHIDESQTNNTNENNYWVGLEQADGLNQLNNGINRGNAGDPFPGSTNNQAFNCNSTPNSKLYNGTSANISIDTIAITGNLASFHYGPCATPLSIELDKIEAANTGGRQNLITWRSLTEESEDYYELEKSADGQIFEKMKTVKSKNTPSQYAVTDENGVSGTNYYRLKMIGQNGHFSYSKTVSAYVKEGNLWTLTAYPNPVSEKLTITVDGPIAAGAHVRLLDVTGKLIRDITVTGPEQPIDLKNITRGVYFIKYEDGSHTQTLRITKE